MPAEIGYKVAVVIVDVHEPEGETAGRLLAIADEKGYSHRVVEAQRGEHDAALSFRVPQDVAEAFNAERSDLWPDDSARRVELGHIGVDGSTRENAGPDDATKIENDTVSARKERTGKAPKE